MVGSLSPQSTHKDNILYYKVIMVTINTPNFAKVISDIVVCHYDLSDLVIAIKTLSDVVICHHDFPGSVITNSNTFYPLKT